MRLAFTADLHWGTHHNGDEATQLLVGHLLANPPEVLVLAGDVGAGSHFEHCLELFDPLACRKALVPGNHDIWVESADERGDSLQVYRQGLPERCSRHGFHYLDQSPLVLNEDLALAGSINWYDYSWSLEQLRQVFPGEEHRLRTKLFSRGRHNDVRFVRWPLDDAQFTAQVVADLEKHIEQALAQAASVIVVTHHPPFRGLGFPQPETPVTLDGLLWRAFSGNLALEAVLSRHETRIPFAFCGHTHRQRENRLGAIQGYNIGGDYHFKRLLVLDWAGRKMEAHTFGDPERR